MFLYAHHFLWKVRCHVGCMISCPAPLSYPSEEAPAFLQNEDWLCRTASEISSACFSCSHPNSLKLPHSPRQKKNVEQKS